MINTNFVNKAQEEMDTLKANVSQDRFIFERALTSAEVSNKRLWITNIILILALILSNCAWIYYESQWQYVETETSFEAEQDGMFNNISNTTLGDYYGTESESNK